MDKAQTIHTFWSSFDWPAYDEGSVPIDAPYPRITYNVAEDELGEPIPMYASLWDRDSSWRSVSEKTEQISRAISNMSPSAIPFDGGRIFIKKGTPFAQRMTDPDDMVRRVYINIITEYFSAY